MNIVIKFVDFENTDVIATSGCAYEGKEGYLIYAYNNLYYMFEGSNNEFKSLAYDTNCTIYGTDGKVLENNVPVVGAHYHPGATYGEIWLCEDDSHKQAEVKTD